MAPIPFDLLRGCSRVESGSRTGLPPPNRCSSSVPSIDATDFSPTHFFFFFKSCVHSRAPCRSSKILLATRASSNENGTPDIRTGKHESTHARHPRTYCRSCAQLQTGGEVSWPETRSNTRKNIINECGCVSCRLRFRLSLPSDRPSTPSFSLSSSRLEKLASS